MQSPSAPKQSRGDQGRGCRDPGHHDVIQSSPIDGWIGDIGEDVVVMGVAMKRVKHEVTSPLVVERRVF
jgi:hypothetical protein